MRFEVAIPERVIMEQTGLRSHEIEIERVTHVHKEDKSYMLRAPGLDPNIFIYYLEEQANKLGYDVASMPKLDVVDSPDMDNSLVITVSAYVQDRRQAASFVEKSYVDEQVGKVVDKINDVGEYDKQQWNNVKEQMDERFRDVQRTVRSLGYGFILLLITSFLLGIFLALN